MYNFQGGKAPSHIYVPVYRYAIIAMLGYKKKKNHSINYVKRLPQQCVFFFYNFKIALYYRMYKT